MGRGNTNSSQSNILDLRKPGESRPIVFSLHESLIAMGLDKWSVRREGNSSNSAWTRQEALIDKLIEIGRVSSYDFYAPVISETAPSGMLFMYQRPIDGDDKDARSTLLIYPDELEEPMTKLEVDALEEIMITRRNHDQSVIDITSAFQDKVVLANPGTAGFEALESAGFKDGIASACEIDAAALDKIDQQVSTHDVFVLRGRAKEIFFYLNDAARNAMNKELTPEKRLHREDLRLRMQVELQGLAVLERLGGHRFDHDLFCKMDPRGRES